MALITFYSNVVQPQKFVDNLFGFTTLLTESKYIISVSRYVSSNDMVYFSPHALFSQAQSQIIILSDKATRKKRQAYTVQYKETYFKQCIE